MYTKCDHSASSVRAELLPNKKLLQFEFLLDVFRKTKEQFKNIPSRKERENAKFYHLRKENRCEYYWWLYFLSNLYVKLFSPLIWKDS